MITLKQLQELLPEETTYTLNKNTDHVVMRGKRSSTDFTGSFKDGVFECLVACLLELPQNFKQRRQWFKRCEKVEEVKEAVRIYENAPVLPIAEFTNTEVFRDIVRFNDVYER